MDKIIDIVKKVVFVIWAVMQALLIHSCFQQIYQYLNENAVEGFERFVIIGETVIMTFVTIVFVVVTAYLAYREVRIYHEEHKQTNENETS